MNSIATQISTINVPFHGQSVPTIYHDGQPFIAMRPIVENIGIDWTGQSVKLRNQKEKFNCRDISMVAADGKIRSLLCLPLKKLNGWLFSINPERVRADIKDKLIQYQDECFSVLYDYWTKGEAVNPRKKTTVDQRTPLRDAVSMLVGKKGLRYDDAYNMVHQRFAIDSIDELELSQIPEAVEYIHRVVLHGEFIAKDEGLIAEPVKTPSRAPAYRYLVCMTVEDAISGRTEVLKGGANCATEIVNGTAKKFGIHIFDMMPVPTTPFC